MDKNTMLELEALKMEARAVESRRDITMVEIENHLNRIARRIRALKEPEQKEGEKVLPCNYPNGLQVSELKALIKYWPDLNQHGYPNEVFIETGDYLSGPAIRVLHLNGIENDLLLESGAWDKEADAE